MESFMSAAALDRSQVEVRSTAGGWLVIFHAANLNCGEDGPYFPGACRGPQSGTPVYRDAYTCVSSLPGMGGLRRGASPHVIGPYDDPCERSIGW